MKQSNRRPRVNRRKKTARKAKGLTKSQKQQVKAIVSRQEETKYHAEQLLTKYQLDWGIHTYADPAAGTPNGDILPLVPSIMEGDGSWQRSGAKVKPTKCRVDVEVSIAENPLGLTPITPFTADIYVVMYLLRSKTFKNYRQFVEATKAGDFIGDLLNNGDGTSKYFGNAMLIGSPPTSIVYSNATDLQLPVNSKYFTLVKKKIVRLTKNAGLSYGDGVPNAPNLGKSSWRGSFTYTLPTLTYDEYAQNTQYVGPYPTNNCTFLAIGSALANGLDSLTYQNGEVSGVLGNPMLLNVRNHVWYKDA